MNREMFEQAKIELHDSAGPCTRALNAFLLRSKGAPFFDHMFFQADLFYMVYTRRIWHDQLWTRTESSIIREFEDEDMELANNCLYRFQTICDQELLSTRNPVSFYKSLDSYWSSPFGNFNTVASVFLFAVADRGFLFDSAIQGSVPSVFITRAFIDQLKTSDRILQSPTLLTTKCTPPLGMRYDHMQEQVRNFHLMLPSRITYCDYWENQILPLVQKMQYMNRCYHRDFDCNYSPDSNIRYLLTDAVMECFIWYMATRQHLGVESVNDLTRKVLYLQNKRQSPDQNEFKKNMADFVDLILVEDSVYAFPYFVFRIISKYYSKLENGELPNIKRLLREIHLELNLEIKPHETSSEQWNRWNLLLFKQICHKTALFLPEGAVERSMYIFEFSEQITMEYYPSDELLTLEASDGKIAAYISKGENTGSAVLPELKELVDYAVKNLAISPFDILNYRTWNETLYSLWDFLNSSKGGKGSGRGRKPTKKKLLSGIISTLSDYPELKESYFHLVFEDSAGYGSGLPTYDWAFRLAGLIDQIINTPEIRNALADDLMSNPELVELGIHQFFLSELTQEVSGLIAILGKQILYGDNVQELVIQPI